MNTHVPPRAAAVIAAVTAIIGQLVAFVPSTAAYQQVGISVCTDAVIVAFLIANALHHRAAGAAAALPAPSPAPASPANAERLRAQVRAAGMEPVA